MSSFTVFIAYSLMVSLFLERVEPKIVSGLTTEDKELIVESHNRLRTLVTDAANMQKMAWDNELATIAQSFAEQCKPEPNINCTKQSMSFDHVGENLFIATESVNYFDAIATWYSEQHDYDYSLGLCNGVCAHYTQIVWAASASIGCGAFSCPLNPESAQFIFICNYGPGGNIGGKLPYIEGHRCSECLKDQQCDLGLCAYTETDYSLVLPHSNFHHFGLQLADGHYFCYTIPGESNATYNLLSTNKLKINAMLIPDRHGRKTSRLGSVGITVLHVNQRKTTKIRFLIKEHLVDISNKVTLDAYSVEKLTITKEGKLILLPFVGKLNASKDATVRVELKDMDLNFTVRFVKHHHLDVFWESKGMSDNIDGLIGQYLHKTVKIDEQQELLFLPGKNPVPVERTSLWNFMERETFDKGHTCWSTIHPSSQAKEVIQGSYLDYKVGDIFSAEFKVTSNYTL